MKNNPALKSRHFSQQLTRLGRLSLALLASLTLQESMAATEADLNLERFDQALSLKPNVADGRKKYYLCVSCHGPEGWGTANGSYPQIAGQLQSVSIKQLHDIYSGKRGNPIMEAFTSIRVLESAQDIADLTAYIAELPMTDQNGKGDSTKIPEGKKLYADYCVECHGENGEGHFEDQIPRLQAQHYNYLMRQFSWIRGGHRKNADKKMIKQIQGLSLGQQAAIMSYVASLPPPKADLAKPGWKNPDFPNHDRRWEAPPPRVKPLQE
jgi:cytochrome c553